MYFHICRESEGPRANGGSDKTSITSERHSVSDWLLSDYLGKVIRYIDIFKSIHNMVLNTLHLHAFLSNANNQ